MLRLSTPFVPAALPCLSTLPAAGATYNGVHVACRHFFRPTSTSPEMAPSRPAVFHAPHRATSSVARLAHCCHCCMPPRSFIDGPFPCPLTSNGVYPTDRPFGYSTQSRGYRHAATTPPLPPPPERKKRRRHRRRALTVSAFNIRAAAILTNPSKPVAQRFRLVTSLLPALEPGRTPRHSDLNVTAQDVAVRILTNVQRLGWKADHSLLYNLMHCAYLDRDWDLIADMLPELHEPQCDLSQVWSLFLPLLSVEKPALAIQLVSVHLLSSNSDDKTKWNWKVLSNRSVAHAVMLAAKSTQAHSFLELLASALTNDSSGHLSLPLLHELIVLSASHPHLFFEPTCERLRHYATKPSGQPSSDLSTHFSFRAALATQHLSQALQLAHTSPAVCMPDVLRALLRQPCSTLRNHALQLFQTLVDLRTVTISDSQFLTFVNAAPASHACDLLWYRLHREQSMRLTHRSAIALLAWTATHAPNRLPVLLRHMVNDRVCLTDSDLPQWHRLLGALRSNTTLSLPKHDEITMLLYSAIDLSLPVSSYTSLDSLFVQHFAHLGRADTLRYFIRHSIRNLPVSKCAVRAITASFPPTIAFSLLVELWHMTRSTFHRHTFSLSSDQWEHWLKLHQAIQLLSSTVRPQQCQFWTRRLEDVRRSALPRQPQRPLLALKNERRSSNWDVLIPLVRSLGRLGDSDSLARVATSAAPSGASDPRRISALSVAFARCGEIARAEALIAQLDPTSRQYRTARAALTAAQLRASRNLAHGPSDSMPNGLASLTSIRDPRAFNLHLTFLRNQGQFEGVIDTVLSSESSLVDAATLTIVITSTLRGLNALEAEARVPQKGHLLPRSSNATEQHASRIKQTVLKLVLLHAPRVGHRYHAHLLFDLLVATRPSLMPWSTVIDVLSAMLNGSFGGNNKLSDINHGRPSSATIARVHNLMLVQLKEIGLLDYGLVSSNSALDDHKDPKVVARDLNLRVERIEALASKDREHASELEGMVDLLKWMDAHLSSVSDKRK